MRTHLEVLLALAACGLSACGTNASTPPVASLAPEMVVSLRAASFTCDTKDQLAATLNHLYRHEATLFKTMFDGRHGCTTLGDGTQPLKILSLADATPLAKNDMAQVQMRDADPVWVNSDGLQPVKP
jgi:hypothetical protein